MQTIIFLSLIILGANATVWRRQEYPNSQWTVPQGRPFHWGNDRTLNYQHGFPPWYPQQTQSQQNMEIEKSLAEAEWICRNPKTGDVLILAPQTEDQSKRPTEEFIPNNEPGQGQGMPNQQDTKFPNVQTTTERFKTPDETTHGGEGLIDVRFGES